MIRLIACMLLMLSLTTANRAAEGSRWNHQRVCFSILGFHADIRRADGASDSPTDNRRIAFACPAKSASRCFSQNIQNQKNA